MVEPDYVMWSSQMTHPELWMMKSSELFEQGRELLQRSFDASDNMDNFIQQFKDEQGPDWAGGPVPIPPSLMYEWGLSETGGMLIGFAIENALKGLLVQRSFSARPIDTERFKDTVLRTHNLLHLARSSLDLPCSPEEKELLTLLRRRIEWIGRYPRPTKIEEASMSRGLRPADLLRADKLRVRILKLWKNEGGRTRAVRIPD